MTAWYFAYGSNLDPDTFLRRRRMRPLATRRARLPGYRLVFDLPVGKGERAVANVIADPDAAVDGVAYRLTLAQCAFLDKTEGVPMGYYRRLLVPLRGDDGARFVGFTYGSPKGRPGRKPSARYMGLILRGARHHGLAETYIEFLEGFELAADERTDPA